MSGGSDSGGPIRLLLVHGSRLRREALAAWLRSCDDFRLVGSAAPAELVLDLPDARRVDVVLVDASDGSTEARRTIERLREERPDLKIFVIGLDRGPEVAVEFIEAGAGGWVERGASRQELAAALHALHAERTRAAPGVLARLLERIETLTRSRPSAPPPLAELTDREHEVLELVAYGLTNKEIAHRLGKDPASVLYHVRRLVRTGFLVPEPARRGTRGAREVPYRATGKSWVLDVVEPEVRRAGSVAMFEAFVAEAQAAGLDRVTMTRLGLRLTDSERRELNHRLHVLFDEYVRREPTPGALPWSLFYAAHPDPRPVGNSGAGADTP